MQEFYSGTYLAFMSKAILEEIVQWTWSATECIETKK